MLEKRHQVVLLCGLSSLVCYADRVNVSVAVLHMGLDGMRRGWVLASFFYGYITTQLLGGVLSSRFGGSLVLNVAVAWWSAFTLLTPLAARHSVGVLVLCRVLMGAGEGLAFPALYDILSRWAPPSERARSFAAVQLGVKAGTVLALALCPPIIEAVGWPAVFYGFGALGFIWNGAWMLFMAGVVPPVDYHHVTGKEDGERPEGAVARGVTSKVAAQLLSSPSVWAIVAGHTSYNWGHYMLLSWLPTYLHEAHGVAKDALGVSTIPFASMSIGVVAWSTIADRWAQTSSVTTVRKGMTTIGLGGAALLILMLGQARSAAGVIILSSLTLAVQSASLGGCHVNHVDLAPKYASFILGISNTAATLPGMVAVPLASAIVTSPWGRWHHVFMVASAVYAAGVLVYRRWMSAEPLLLVE